MNKGINVNVWRIIMDSLAGGLRKWADYANVGTATIWGWKAGTHFPREDSLICLLDAIQKRFTNAEKLDLFNKILDSYGIRPNSSEWERYKEEANDDFALFLKNVILDEKKAKKISYYGEGLEESLLNSLIENKLKSWFEHASYVSVKSIKINNRNAFIVQLKDKNYFIPPIVFSYTQKTYQIEKEEENLNIFFDDFNKKYTNNYLVHIAITMVSVKNSEYSRILKKYNTYLKTIQNEEFNATEINYGYTCLSNYVTIERERELNIYANVIFKKFLESSYLIYKEIICCKYQKTNIDHNFFQSNVGIVNYPYAMRRAISFEKKVVENVLKELRKKRKDKIDLLIDLNCLGGLYGLRLYQHCRQVLCVDESLKTLQTINNIVETYNKEIRNQDIVNVITELFREEGYEILSNQNLFNRVDCIIVGLGTMSYIKSPDLFLRTINNLLKEDGYIFLSCYNLDSLSVKLNKFKNLNYIYDSYNERFIYFHNKINIPVPVKMYSFSEFKNIVLRYFDVIGEDTWSYPVISSIFSMNEYSAEVNIIKEVDKASAMYNRYLLANGNYNMVVAKRHQSSNSSEIYIKTKCFIMDMKINCNEITHLPFTTKEEIFKELKESYFITPNNFIKTVIIKDVSKPENINYYMILLPANKRLKWDLLKQYYNIKGKVYQQTKIQFCTEKDLIQMGFTIGSICPFSYSILKESYSIDILYDYSMCHMPYETIYTYSGKNNMTFELQLDSCLEYLNKEGAFTYKYIE